MEGINRMDARHLSPTFLGYDGTLLTSNNERGHSYKACSHDWPKSWFALESNGGRKGIRLAGWKDGFLFLFPFAFRVRVSFVFFWHLSLVPPKGCLVGRVAVSCFFIFSLFISLAACERS